MEEELGIRLRANGVVETTKGLDLTGDAAERLGARLDTVSQRLPQMAQGSREAASGATVLGGALREAANEATAALPVPVALRGALLGLGNTFGLVATAALVAGSAYVQGAREGQAYRQAIVLTGNAAGVTTGMLGDMGRQVAALVGTQREASSVLASLVGSGQVAAGELKLATETALRLQGVAGIAVEETVRQFIALGKDPVKASVSLNESTNFLTRSLYEQLRALEQQGKQSTAAALAQNAYAEAMNSRAVQLEASLGVIERSWNAVTGAAKGAWDAMLDLGREQTLSQKIASVEAQINALDTRRSENPQLTARRRAVLAEQLEGLRETERLSKRAATAQAEEAARTRDYIAKREGERDKKPRAAANPTDRLDDSIQRRLALAQAELAAGDQLSQADRFRIELLRQIDDVQGKIGAKRAGELRTQVESTAQQMRAVEAQREEAKAREALEKQFAAEREAATKAAYAQREQMQQRNATLAEETAAVGLSTEALHARRQAQIDTEIADRAAHLARIEGLPAYAEEAAVLQQQIALLQQRKGLQQGKYVADERQKELEENDKRREALTDSIADGIMEGFRDGRSYVEIFRRELQAQFANTVLRPSIKVLVDQAWGGGGSGGGLVGGLLGLLGIGGGGGGGYSGVLPSGLIPMGAAMARGGRAERGTLHPINEEGPEVISVGQRSYLMMGAQDGQVTPAGRGGGGGAGGGGGITIYFAPVTHIDSRTDRAEVAVLVQRANRQSQAELLEMMERGQV